MRHRPGQGAEGARRKRENRPLLAKPITSELGNVSPIVVVPGEWSDADLDFHAENLATQMTQNGGFNCNAAKVIVTTVRQISTKARMPEKEKNFLGDIMGKFAFQLERNPE